MVTVQNILKRGVGVLSLREKLSPPLRKKNGGVRVKTFPQAQARGRQRYRHEELKKPTRGTERKEHAGGIEEVLFANPPYWL